MRACVCVCACVCVRVRAFTHPYMRPGVPPPPYPSPPPVQTQKIGALLALVGFYVFSLPCAFGLAFLAHKGLRGLWMGMNAGYVPWTQRCSWWEVRDLLRVPFRPCTPAMAAPILLACVVLVDACVCACGVREIMCMYAAFEERACQQFCVRFRATAFAPS